MSHLLEPAPQGMVGAEGASSGQQRGRDLLGPLNTTSILTSESQLALSDPCPSAQNSTWLDHPQVEHTHQTFFYFLATVSAEENNFSNFHLGWHACSDLL